MKRPNDTRQVSYRNLDLERGTIWYRRMVNGRRHHVDTRYEPTPEGWKQAARWRDLYEEEKRIGEPGEPKGAVPTFAAFAQRYLEEDTRHLAGRTRLDRKRYLGPDGLLLPHLGTKRLDDITPTTLREWWTVAIDAPARSRRTGDNHVNTLAAIFEYARELALVRESPVDELRRQLKRRRRTKQGRAMAASTATPLERPEDLAKLLEAAAAEGARAHAVVLCLLDTGMRTGELEGLEWRQVAWGRGTDDRNRHISIDGSVASGVPDRGTTKSGRDRKAPLSRRLRAALRAWWMAEGQPGPDERVFPGLNRGAFGRRPSKAHPAAGPWHRACQRAGVGHRKPKDLRDSFASHLLTVGVPVAYVSKLLGHSSIELTLRRYAKYVPDEYVEPMRLEAGEVVPDFLSRLDWPQNWPQNTEESQGTA